MKAHRAEPGWFAVAEYERAAPMLTSGRNSATRDASCGMFSFPRDASVEIRASTPRPRTFRGLARTATTAHSFFFFFFSPAIAATKSKGRRRRPGSRKGKLRTARRTTHRRLGCRRKRFGYSLESSRISISSTGPRRFASRTRCCQIAECADRKYAVMDACKDISGAHISPQRIRGLREKKKKSGISACSFMACTHHDAQNNISPRRC